MSVATSKVRLYDLAKELKIDTKRLIEEVRREGVDVSVPSNSVSKELAEKIRDKYFPKQPTTAKRAIKVVKKAARVIEEPPPVEEAPADEVPIEAEAPALAVDRGPCDPAAAPVQVRDDVAGGRVGLQPGVDEVRRGRGREAFVRGQREPGFRP